MIDFGHSFQMNHVLYGRREYNMHAEAGNPIGDKFHNVNQSVKMQDINTDYYIHIITCGLLDTDDIFIKSVKCLTELDSQETYKFINSAIYFWDVFNFAKLICDEFTLFSIDQISNGNVLLGAALMLFFFSQDDRKADFLHIIRRLYDVDSLLADKLIIECEKIRKFPEWLIYILNNGSPELRIEVVLCLPFDFNVFINKMERDKYKSIETEREKLYNDVYNDISFSVREKWKKYIASLLEEKSCYGNLCFSAYVNIILSSLIHCYKDNNNEFITDLEETLTEFENLENEWLYPNQSFCGPYFALITKFHIYHLINEDLKIIGKKTHPKLMAKIEEFKRKQFRYIGYWRNTKHDNYAKYLEFYDAG